MGLISMYLLTTSLVLTGEKNKERDDALNALGKASYIEFKIDKKVKKWEKRYISKEVRRHGAWIGAGLRMIVDKRVSYKWTF